MPDDGDWQSLSHPELQPGYLGEGETHFSPDQLPELLGKYFESKGEDRPMFTIVQVGKNEAWRVTCEVKICVCVAESYFRKTARWVCAAMVFKQLGVSNKDLDVIDSQDEVKLLIKRFKSHPEDAEFSATHSGNNPNYDKFPATSEQLEHFRRINHIKLPNQIFHVVSTILDLRGHAEPIYSITQYVDCAESRAGDSGWWTVSCSSGGMAYEAQGGARVLTKQLSAAGMLVLLGVSGHDVDQMKINLNLKKRNKQNKRKMAKESLRASIEPYPVTKAEPFPLAKAEPFTLAKAEPFPFIKAEPLPFIKAEPFPSIKTEPDLPALVPIIRNQSCYPDTQWFIDKLDPDGKELKDEVP